MDPKACVERILDAVAALRFAEAALPPMGSATFARGSVQRAPAEMADGDVTRWTFRFRPMADVDLWETWVVYTREARCP